MSQFIKQLKPAFEEAALPVVKLLNRVGITPNILTFLGVVFVGIASFFIYKGEFIKGGVILLLGNLCDALDGILARKFNLNSKFGAFFDSLTDRISDFLPIISLGLYFRENEYILMLSAFAVLFSFLVSYARARAEGLGINCNVGIMERTERSAVLILSLLTNLPVAGLVIITAGAAITTIQRIFYVYKNSN
ncbi:CDP-alcohol phosphatidyltransferase family protein [Persephonella sp.]